jgi:hypothetical protein
MPRLRRRPRGLRAAIAGAIAAAAWLSSAPAAHAQRPELDGEPLTHDGELGHVRVHYVTTSSDAVPDDDADGDGTPDYVQEVAALAEIAWEDLVERGFRAPLSDGGLVDDDGGDDRFDIYLRDLMSADGNFVPEACSGTPIHCTGYFSMENDLAGFSYATRTEGIAVLTSHELFHAVQHAYAADMAFAWSEGSAVWNEEKTFPDQDDYERLVAGFLARPERPFDRQGGGFGDPYPYGTALWPTFLDERYGDGLVRSVWEACEELADGEDFLDAVDAVLAAQGDGSLISAWTDFSRWNLFTAERADPARAYAGGADLDAVAIEDDLAAPGAAATSVEGLSARYLPIAVAEGEEENLQITVQVDDGAVAAFFPEDGEGSLGDEIELEREDGILVAPLPRPGNGVLVLTSVRRGGLPRDATVEVTVAPPDEGGDEDEDGCQAARSGGGRVPGTVLLLAALAFWLRGPARRRHHRRGEPS